MIQRLFVYGTLAPGQVNHKMLEHIPGEWEVATLRGILLQEGWGAEMGCPGIIPTEGGDEIEGFVFSSTHLMNYWETLDTFEGDGYERKSVTVKVNGVYDVEAYVYALRGQVRER